MRLLTSTSGGIWQLTYNNSGTILNSCEGERDYPRDVHRWDLSTGRECTKIPLEGTTHLAALSQRADVLAYVEENSVVMIGLADQWLDSFELERGPASTLTISADGSTLALARRRVTRESLYGSEIQIIPVAADGRPRKSQTYYSGESLRLLAFSPDTNYLATAGHSQLTLWDLVRGESAVAWSNIAVTQFVFSPDGARLAVASEGIVYLWNCRANTKWDPVERGYRYPIRALAFSPDGRILATGSKTEVRFWDTNECRQLAQWDWNIGEISALAFAPDGLTAAAGSEDGQIVVWDIGD
jgi:WD40 repeat protein